MKSEAAESSDGEMLVIWGKIGRRIHFWGPFDGISRLINKPTKTEAEKKQVKRTESLPPRFFLSPYQDKKRPHPATLPARRIEDQFDPKEAVLKLLKNQEKIMQPTLPPPKETKEKEEGEEDELEVVTEISRSGDAPSDQGSVSERQGLRRDKAQHEIPRPSNQFFQDNHRFPPVESGDQPVLEQLEPTQGADQPLSPPEQPSADKGKGQILKQVQELQDPQEQNFGPEQPTNGGLQQSKTVQQEDQQQQMEGNLPYGEGLNGASSSKSKTDKHERIPIVSSKSEEPNKPSYLHIPKSEKHKPTRRDVTRHEAKVVNRDHNIVTTETQNDNHNINNIDELVEPDESLAKVGYNQQIGPAQNRQ
ncbi:hypothetical protein PTTG_07258 [Puccinia triticina 1-1 BBBD Race 1]|uniref:Uncharacterized protein n=1 Tax=Puccinia triticina (isolate 1-1 / race 1 (BBBD)) TaxID=630390 RepID=A0A180G750_PUCT1|nr:hypothetical protein PTTG_07258 [Puccinia triticina 1-1 BBBD Race 1]